MMEISLDNDCTQNPEEKTVVDERCYCGHRKSQHAAPPLTRQEGGIMKCLRCTCREFVFFGWIFSDGSET